MDCLGYWFQSMEVLGAARRNSFHCGCPQFSLGNSFKASQGSRMVKSLLMNGRESWKSRQIHQERVAEKKMGRRVPAINLVLRHWSG
ncbi:unnamed protein product, partial [Nesidiocoris tenuis]